MASFLSRVPVYFFRGAPTDHVILSRGGKEVASLLGGAFWVFPWHTLVKIPQAELTYAFTFRELSKDLQEMTVNGEVRVRLSVDAMKTRRDFSVERTTGAYVTDDIRKVEGEVRNALSGFVRRQVTAGELKALLTATDSVRDEVWKAVGADKETFAALGVEVIGIVVTAIAPSNAKLREALEAETREKMLAQADKAVHERRMSSAAADRAHQEYALATQQTLEEGRAKLIEVTNANLVKQAEAEAQAAEKKLAPFKDVPAETLFALALQKAAENGIGTLNVSPDLLSAFRALKA